MMISVIGNTYRRFSGGRAERGIALIEVLLSIALLSTVLVVIHQSLLGGLSAMTYLDTRAEAAHLATQKIWEFKTSLWNSNKVPLETDSGILLGRQRKYHYTLRVRPLDAKKKLFEGDLQVMWLVGGIKKKIGSNFYVKAGRFLIA